MLIKPITYTTFDGVEITENFYFNMTKAELMEQMLLAENKESNFEKAMRKIIESGDGQQLVPQFKKIISMSYGIRSDDGKVFRKSPEISRDFENHAAYDVLFQELLSSQQNMEDFINKVMPSGLVTDAQREVDSQQENTPVIPSTAEPVLEEKTPSQLARERSEANLQGHKPKQSSVTIPAPLENQLVEEDDPAQIVDTRRVEHDQITEDERRELEELRRLRDERARQQ